jgi:alpha-1,6-mannosyltransferase
MGEVPLTLGERSGVKICDLAQAYATRSGGIKTYLDAKRRYLASVGDHEHVLVVPGERDSITRDGPHTTYTVRAARVPGREEYRFMLRLGHVASILRAESPDLIEIATPYVLPWVALRHRRQTGAHVVGFYHADFPNAYVEEPLRKSLPPWVAGGAGLAARNYARAVYSRCDAVICSSGVLRDRLHRMGVTSVAEVQLGVDTETFDPRARDAGLRAELGVPDDAPLLLYAGRLDHEKRVQLVVDAFEGLPDRFGAHLVIVGDGPLRKELEQRAERLGRLGLLPYRQDRAELARLMASADVYVTAGPHETFGLSVVEAQACGLPVVGVAGGALVDRVPPGTGLLARVDDPDDIRASLERLLSGDYRAAGRRARAHVLDRHRWDECLHRMTSLYEFLRRDVPVGMAPAA